MQPVYVTIVYNKEKRDLKLPKVIIVNKDNKNNIIRLYDNNANKSIKQIKIELEKLKTVILKYNDKGVKIVTDCFRNLVDALQLPLDMREYNVYDMHIHEMLYDEDGINLRIGELQKRELRNYQKVLANSSIVFADMEKKGLYYNFSHVKPVWTQDTYSGRSKSTGFNIQGFTEHAKIQNISSLETDMLIHFDWICADIRVASILSDDENLKKSFARSDPYKYLMKSLNNSRKEKGLEETFDRDECKLILLKGINSLDFRSMVFTNVYPRLGEWMSDVSSSDVSETMLGRKFHVTDEKNRLSVFNGVMQGSVAHAMQSVLRRVWLKLQDRLVCDVHDSIVLNVGNNRNDLMAVMKIVSEIMLDPFMTGDIFPIKVSIGKRWREYKNIATIYNHNDLSVL